MSLWLMLGLAVITWFAYVLAGTLSLAVQKLKGKRPADAGFSFVEIIVVSFVLLIVTELIEGLVPSWGRRIFAGLHGLMLVAFGVGAIVEWVRLARLRRKT